MNPSRRANPEPVPAPAGERVIVIGASIAGLFAARILSERFAQVWLLERDELPDAALPRKGTPHAIQPHGLLARGLQVMEELFPGFTDSLVAQGALKGDIGMEVVFDADRHRFQRLRSGHVGLLASRLAIEAELRRRTRALPGVTVLAGVDVIEPIFDAAAGRVSGVRMIRREHGRNPEPAAEPETVAADLVVDCSGRGSRSPSWLDGWGYQPAREQRVRIDLAYVSAYFERESQPADTLERGARTADIRGVISTATPGLPRPAVLLAQEPDAQGRNRWVLGVGGYGDDQPDGSIEGMRQRAQAIGCAELIDVAERRGLIGQVLRYRFPHSQRRHYERMRRFPAGYLVMGDALASFNPIYGQGMTVAACEALELRRVLGHGLDGLAPRFFKAAARVIDIPWQTAVGGDLALPMVPGPRPFPVRLVNAYLKRVFEAAAEDAQVAAAFLQVMHMLRKPPSLMTPRIMWRVLWASRRHAVGSYTFAPPLPRP